MKIIFADPDCNYRKHLINVLQSEKINHFAEFEDGSSLIDYIRLVAPDMLLLELNLPMLNGKEVFLFLKKNHPGCKIIILSSYDDHLLKTRYVDAGASLFLSKNQFFYDRPNFIDAIKSVINNKITTFPALRVYEDNKLNLTSRQIKIMELIFNGFSNKEISSALGISIRAVEKHRKNIYLKFGTDNSIDFYKYAFSRGLQYCV